MNPMNSKIVEKITENYKDAIHAIVIMAGISILVLATAAAIGLPWFFINRENNRHEKEMYLGGYTKKHITIDGYSHFVWEKEQKKEIEGDTNND